METRCYGFSGSIYNTNMNIEIDSSDIARVSKHFGDRSDKIEAVFSTIIKKAVLTVERFAKIYSPVKTGRLRSSIQTVDIQERSATVAPTVDYAPFVHARIPFMFAARADSIPEIESMVKDEVKKAIK